MKDFISFLQSINLNKSSNTKKVPHLKAQNPNVFLDFSLLLLEFVSSMIDFQCPPCISICSEHRTEKLLSFLIIGITI